MREALLRHMLKNCPDGDLNQFQQTTLKISCVFVFYHRIHLMTNILHCLNRQSLDKKNFEVILVEDRGGSNEGRQLADRFKDLTIRHFSPDIHWGKMGFMRNFGLSRAAGKIILFLDDDTLISDRHFLDHLVREFESAPCPDAVQPRGFASYSLIRGRYAYHDPYFFTNRCMAYQKKCLEALKGFNSDFTGQEDVELAIRFTARRMAVKQSETLFYYHPPLIFKGTAKGEAVGASFARTRYSAFFKALLLINGSRWLPLLLFPGPQFRFMGIFALGFLKGFLRELSGRNSEAEYL
nr:glycosyltransferase [uncultured Desulfobacter sp.]